MTARDEAWSQAAAPKAKYSIELDPGPDKGGTPFDVLAKQYLSGLDAGTDDPAFTGRDVDATDSNTRARAKLVYKDVPLVTIQNT